MTETEPELDVLPDVPADPQTSEDAARQWTDALWGGSPLPYAGRP